MGVRTGDRIDLTVAMPFLDRDIPSEAAYCTCRDAVCDDLSKHLDGWLEAMTPFLKQLHLHDNKGGTDEHLPVGAGAIAFDRLFSHLNDNRLKPIITVEAHKEKDLWDSIETLSRWESFRRIIQRS